MILPMEIEFQRGCPNVKMEVNISAPHESCLAVSFAKPVTKHRMGITVIQNTEGKDWCCQFNTNNALLGMVIAILNTVWVTILP